MNKFLCFLTFTGGIAIGVATTWQYAKKKYERIAQEEIDSVKAVFSKHKQMTGKEANKLRSETMESRENTKKDISKYQSKLYGYGYADCSHSVKDRFQVEFTEKKDEMEEEEQMDHPYIITPNEFGEFEDYDTISLTYYSDGILADDDDELVDNPEEIVGRDSVNHFGEYEDDSVFVRNDRMRCDYEILLDHRTYSEAIQNRPPRLEG